MKTLFRILVIMVVAVLIGGAFYGAVTASSSGTDGTSIQERPRPDGFPAERPEGEDFEGGIQFPAEMIKSLVIMTVVATASLNLPKLFNWKKPNLKAGL